MVGWSRRSRESAERARRYNEWFNSLSPDKQAEIRQKRIEKWKRNEPFWFLAIIVSCLLFVLWPLMNPLGYLFFKPRVMPQHTAINGRNCIVYPRTCTSTGACRLEHTECN